MFLPLQASVTRLKSPDERLKVVVTVDGSISWRVDFEGIPLLLPSEIDLQLDVPDILPGMHQTRNLVRRTVSDTIFPVVREKRAFIPDHYNELLLEMNGGISLQFRAYNDGVAYRFISSVEGEVTVLGETARFSFPGSTEVYYAAVEKRPDADKFHTSFEEPYRKGSLTLLEEEALFMVPLLCRIPGGLNVLIAESDVYDYPGMFISKTGGSVLGAVFPPAPLKDSVWGEEFRYRKVMERASFLAKTNGSRTYPWRILAVETLDGGLLSNDIVYRLAAPAPEADYSWIKPGKSTEEWITGLNLYGVDFEAGLNTETYLYYIDFAARFGLEYVMLDAGWSDVNDLRKINPDMDMEAITQYARKKGVGLILWTQALTFERQAKEVLGIFQAWDIKVIMTDFIDRNDQEAINFMDSFASLCADKGFMCMIHGAPPPAGFSRTHPNMLTREGVLGSEYNIWSDEANPIHDLLLPFIRMPSGPMDYEPGILQHATREQSGKMGFERVIAQGTRMHQAAMFVIYDSPLQLFSGNLSDAMGEPEFMEFLGAIPTVWDETQIIAAKLGEFAVILRRSGNEWFLAAMNDWTPAEFSIPLEFLEKGEYCAEIAEDGINASRNPHDYRISTEYFSSRDILPVRLAPGGGYVARFRPIIKN